MADAHSRLPTELVQMVIESALDQATLSSCSLLSKVFRTVGQTCLFRTVSIPAHVSLSSFRKFLQANPRFVSYIRNVKLAGSVPGSLDFQDSYPGSFVKELLLSELEALVAEVPHLVNLLVRNFHVVDDRQYQVPSSTRPSLQRLVVINVSDRLGTTNDWTYLFNCFSFIEELILHDIPLYSSRDRPSESPYPPIRSIIYEMGDNTILLCEGLIKLGDLQSLQSVDIVCTCWDDVRAVATLSDECRLSIKRIVFDPFGVCDRDDLRAETWDALGLERCTQLESLVLYITLGGGRGTSGFIVWDAVIAILSTAPETIRDVTIRFRIESLEAELIAADAWFFPREVLDSTLRSFKDLATVTFEFERNAPPDYHDNCQRIVKGFMPFTMERGLLRFGVCSVERKTRELVRQFWYSNIR